MDRRQRAVEHARHARTIKVNFRAAPRKMQHAVEPASAKRSLHRRGQAGRFGGAIDHDAADLDAGGRQRAREIAGAILTGEVQNGRGAAAVAGGDQVDEIVDAPIRRRDIAETGRAGGLGRALPNHISRQRQQLSATRMLRDCRHRIGTGQGECHPGAISERHIAERFNLKQWRQQHLGPARAQFCRRPLAIRLRPGDEYAHGSDHREEIGAATPLEFTPGIGTQRGRV